MRECVLFIGTRFRGYMTNLTARGANACQVNKEKRSQASCTMRSNANMQAFSIVVSARTMKLISEVKWNEDNLRALMDDNGSINLGRRPQHTKAQLEMMLRYTIRWRGSRKQYLEQQQSRLVKTLTG